MSGRKRRKVPGLDQPTRAARAKFLRDLHSGSSNAALYDLRDMYYEEYMILKKLHEDRLVAERGPIPGDSE